MLENYFCFVKVNLISSLVFSLSFCNNEMGSIKESRAPQPLHSSFIYMQSICCNETLFFGVTSQESQSSRCLCLLLTCLPVCSLSVSGPGLPFSLHNQLVANKQLLAPVVGRQRGHRAAGQNCQDAQHLSATPTQRRQTATRTASDVADFKKGKEECEGEGWSQTAAAGRKGATSHFGSRKHAAPPALSLHFYWKWNTKLHWPEAFRSTMALVQMMVCFPTSALLTHFLVS